MPLYLSLSPPVSVSPLFPYLWADGDAVSLRLLIEFSSRLYFTALQTLRLLPGSLHLHPHSQVPFLVILESKHFLRLKM